MNRLLRIEERIKSENLIKSKSDNVPKISEKSSTDSSLMAVTNNENFIDSDDGEEIPQKNSKAITKDKITKYSEDPQLTKEKVVYKYFRSLLKQWEQDLENREDSIKFTAKGKIR